jgi:hypothetical protein
MKLGYKGAALTLVLATASALSATATPALASFPAWGICTKPGTKEGSFEDAKCTKEKAEGEYEWTEAISGTEVTTSTIPGQSLTLEDTGAKTAMECTGGGAGKLGTNGTGELTAASATSCKFVSGKNGVCEASKPVTAKAVHLPWKTKLEEKETEIRNTVENSGSGEPGWAMECTIAGIFKVADTCEGPTNAKTSNIATEGEVEAEFEAKSPTVKCSVGGAGTGRAAGRTKAAAKGVAGLKFGVGKMKLPEAPVRIIPNGSTEIFPEYVGLGKASELRVSLSAGFTYEAPLIKGCKEAGLELKSTETCIVKITCTQNNLMGVGSVGSKKDLIFGTGDRRLECR